tara:strand:- start:3332 stop:3586 length:255 start_codon:yes stop_codon:yes gene_type:complete
MTEEFEKWFADEFGTCPQPNDASWAEWEHTKNRSRYAWQASRKQALEEAAKECEKLSEKTHRSWLVHEAAFQDDCADAIRALQQ